ncbi:MAG: hypothetical protein IJZ74_12665 [Clostridia bacterium]|nr:hypothetical protein [Clostridia bacterium]
MTAAVQAALVLQRPTSLEVLFARQEQGETFLLLMLCGVALGILTQLAGFLHRTNRMAGMAADVLCGVTLAAVLLGSALHAGSGLRLYALLGLCIGLALHAAGIAPIADKMARLLQKTFVVKAGMPHVRAESTVHRNEAEG